MPQALSAGDDSDFIGMRVPLLLADGWIFYFMARYDPAVMIGFTPAALPAGVPNTAANRRKRNRPFFAIIARTTASPSEPWDGTLNFGPASALNPWLGTAAAPYGEEADWAQGPGAHYLADWSVNPAVEVEMAAVTPDAWLWSARQAAFAPAATLTRRYTARMHLSTTTAAYEYVSLFSGTTTAFAPPALPAGDEYQGLWVMDPAFPGDEAKGFPNGRACTDALTDLFIRASV